MSIRLLRRTGLTMAVIAVSLAIAAPVSAAPGNNGTIKIDGIDFDNLPNNEPHVGCEFQVDFYGFDAYQPVRLIFEAQSPSGDASLGTIDTILDKDDKSGGGSEAGHDGSVTHTLVFGADLYEHPKQGYHVKLTINAPGVKDVKHKVFWVTGCEPCEEPEEPEDPNQPT